jgi:hypothetical protein
MTTVEVKVHEDFTSTGSGGFSGAYREIRKRA